MPTPYDCLVAIMILSAPPGTPEMIPCQNTWPGIQAGVHKVAIEWEILDDREKTYIFAKISDFEGDLNMLRRRHQELKDAPRVADSHRLPPRKMVNDLVQFNRAYRKHLLTRSELELDRADILNRAIMETDQLYKVWDAVRDARCEFYYVTVRRQALVKLKNMIGDEDYVLCNLPPYVPIWQFQEVK